MPVPAPVPVLLITGFLGAGKTTVVNQLLAHAGGRRIAAVVNDFGAINIDAELIAGAQDGADGVVSLANGCICCSLEGDLLRTLAMLLRREPRPEHIVIETSGVADPGDIVRNLMDPVIWRGAPLETVLCVLDATTDAAGLADALLRAQLRAADVVALSKLDLSGDAGARVRAAAAAIRPTAVVVEASHGRLPMTLLLPEDPQRPATRPGFDGPIRPGVGRPGAGRRSPVADRFETLSWTCDRPLSLPLLQAAIGRLAPRLARAKGLFETAEAPGREMVFQLAGGRAILSPTGKTAGPRDGAGPAGERPAAPLVRMVFIAEIGVLSAAELEGVMAGCAV
ncbi:MAG: CobW family GTP-binding protein [Janthinobacterium lividum]